MRCVQVVSALAHSSFSFRASSLGVMLLLAPLTLAQPGPSGGGKLFDNNFNQWFVYSGDHRVKGKWGIHLEGQWRRHEFTHPQQLLLRPAVNYSLRPNLILTGGMAFVSSHRYGDYAIGVPNVENRIFEQLIVNQPIRRFSVQHRLRLEQRWIQNRSALADGTRVNLGNRYQNRFRYMFRATTPINDDWYFAAYDQLFLGIAPLRGAKVFDQNRAFAGAGYNLTEDTRLEMGYMQQTVLQRNGRVMELNHVGVHISIYSNLPFAD